MTAWAHWRTTPNGGWRWIGRGRTRGYWRVLVGPPGSPSHLGARGVHEVWAGEPGVSGTTPRSRYYRPQCVADHVCAAVQAALDRGVRDIGELRRVAAAAAGEAGHEC